MSFSLIEGTRICGYADWFAIESPLDTLMVGGWHQFMFVQPRSTEEHMINSFRIHHMESCECHNRPHFQDKLYIVWRCGYLTGNVRHFFISMDVKNQFQIKKRKCCLVALKRTICKVLFKLIECFILKVLKLLSEI